MYLPTNVNDKYVVLFFVHAINNYENNKIKRFLNKHVNEIVTEIPLITVSKHVQPHLSLSINGFSGHMK